MWKATKGRSAYAMLLACICFVAVAAAVLWIVRQRGVPFVGKREQWSIGIYRSDSPLSWPVSGNRGNPVLTAQDVTDVPAKFVADPFLVEENSIWYLIFEVWNTNTNQGDIAVATSKDTRRWKYEGVVLDEPFHLAYPYVFSWQDDYYMIPDSYEANSVRVYRAIEFPYQWSYMGTLVEGSDFVDPSIVRFDERWWMFVSSASEMNSLRLYYADGLMGPWSEHPMSPIVTKDENVARPGGRVVEYGGRLIRYEQDLDSAWRHRVLAYEVTELTTVGYQEEMLNGGAILEASGSSWNEKAMHHIDPYQIEDNTWIASVDGFGSHIVFGLEY